MLNLTRVARFDETGFFRLTFEPKKTKQIQIVVRLHKKFRGQIMEACAGVLINPKFNTVFTLGACGKYKESSITKPVNKASATTNEIILGIEQTTPDCESILIATEGISDHMGLVVSYRALAYDHNNCLLAHTDYVEI